MCLRLYLIILNNKNYNEIKYSEPFVNIII